MLMWILGAYAAIGALVAATTFLDLLNDQAGRDPLVDWADRLIIALATLLVGAAWIVFVPAYLARQGAALLARASGSELGRGHPRGA